MKIMLSIHHPAWVYQFKYIIEQCKKRNDEVIILVAEKDGNTKLLDYFNIPYQLCAKSTGKNVIEKGFLFLKLCFQHTFQAIKHKPDILIGRASPMMAIASFITRKPHFIYEDTEVSKFSLRICKRLSTKIITPITFLTDLGVRQERVDTYKELFYLHPSVFTPSKTLLQEVGFNADEKYILVRFISWNASHDIGKKGLNNNEKIELVKRFSKYCKVYVSDEGDLPEELIPHKINIPYAYIHHLLSFATLVYSEGATMASEAAILGTHALYVNTIVSGSTKEQDERFHLLHCFNDSEKRYDQATKQAEILLNTPNLKEIGKEKQLKLLKEKKDINSYYISEMDRISKQGRN